MCGSEIQGIDILTSVSPRAIQTEPHYNNLRSSNKFLGDSGEGTRKTSGDRGEGGREVITFGEKGCHLGFAIYLK